MNDENKKIDVFICYTKKDEEVANKLYDDVKYAGFSPWMASKDLFLGCKWEMEIRKAIKNSYFFLILHSKSVLEKGYIHKEIKVALDEYDKLPPSEIFIILVRIDENEPDDERLKELHWVDIFPDYDNSLDKILATLSSKKSNYKSRDHLFSKDSITTQASETKTSKNKELATLSSKKSNYKSRDHLFSKAGITTQTSETKMSKNEETVTERLLIENVRKIISSGDIRSAINQIEEYLFDITSDLDLRNEIIICAGRYNRLMQEKRKGIISRDVFNAEINQLANNILNFFEKL